MSSIENMAPQHLSSADATASASSPATVLAQGLGHCHNSSKTMTRVAGTFLSIGTYEVEQITRKVHSFAAEPGHPHLPGNVHAR